MLSFMYTDLHTKHPLFSSDFKRYLNSLDSFSKVINTKFHENPSKVSRVVTCGLVDGQTDMVKLIVAFRHFANASKSKIHIKNNSQNLWVKNKVFKYESESSISN